jgi:hypothetical protein
MTVTAGGVEQIHGHSLDGDRRPVAALALSVDDLPELSWETDDQALTRFAVVRVADHDYVLESEEVPEKQITVYGETAGEPLDQLIAALGLTDEAVWDRVDRDRDVVALSAFESQLMAEVRQSVIESREALQEALRTQEQQLVERKVAAAALELGELTPRERQVLSLMRDGLEIDEIAELLEITPPTVKRYWRSALGELPRGGAGFVTKVTDAGIIGIALGPKASSRSSSSSSKSSARSSKSVSGSRSSSRSKPRSRSRS